MPAPSPPAPAPTSDWSCFAELASNVQWEANTTAAADFRCNAELVLAARSDSAIAGAAATAVAFAALYRAPALPPALASSLARACSLGVGGVGGKQGIDISGFLGDKKLGISVRLTLEWLRGAELAFAAQWVSSGGSAAQ